MSKTIYQKVEDIQVGDTVFYNQVHESDPVTITKKIDHVDSKTLYYVNEDEQECSWNDHNLTLLPCKKR